jgi:hypothetical protein
MLCSCSRLLPVHMFTWRAHSDHAFDACHITVAHVHRCSSPSLRRALTWRLPILLPCQGLEENVHQVPGPGLMLQAGSFQPLLQVVLRIRAAA